MIEITYAIAISFVGMGAAYLMGRYSNKKDMEYIAVSLIELMEQDGYIKTKIDENGVKALVKIDEIR